MNASRGYGIVYREIMRNKNITVEAKAIYAYLCSFAGNNVECYPGIDLMASELCMGKDRLYKHLNILVNSGIVEKHQSRNGNRWGKTVYKINHSRNNEGNCFQYTENEYTEKTVSENQETGKQDTNNNSLNNNSLKNIKEYYDIIWSAYPRKGTEREKSSSFYRFERLVNRSNVSPESIYEAVKGFNQKVDKIYPDKRRIPGFAYFLNDMYKKYLEK